MKCPLVQRKRSERRGRNEKMENGKEKEMKVEVEEDD